MFKELESGIEVGMQFFKQKSMDQNSQNIVGINNLKPLGLPTPHTLTQHSTPTATPHTHTHPHTQTPFFSDLVDPLVL